MMCCLQSTHHRQGNGIFRGPHGAVPGPGSTAIITAAFKKVPKSNTAVSTFCDTRAMLQTMHEGYTVAR
jgi:hypothetical protein